MKRILNAEEVATSGMINKHEQMENGEFRFRLVSEKDGSGYIRTVGGAKGAWQNSHYHIGIRECIIVQKGWIAFAKQFPSGVGIHMKILRDGEMIVVEPNVPYSIYMSAGAVTHTVKFGNTVVERVSGKADWHACPELDRLVKDLSEEQIMFRANMC